MEILKHRIDLFKMKIDTAIARLDQNNPKGARDLLKDALNWDVDIYE